MPTCKWRLQYAYDCVIVCAMNLMTTTAVAKELGISQARVRQLVLAGRLKATKLGRDVFIHPKDLDAVRNRKPGRPRIREAKNGTR